MCGRGLRGGARVTLAAGYPTILRNLGFWVRKLTFLGFLADFTKGK